MDLLDSKVKVLSVLKYQRDDPLLVLLLPPHHGVALPCSGLAVGEDADVVALEGMQQHLLPDVLVNLQLGRKVAVLRLQRGAEGSTHTHTHTQAGTWKNTHTNIHTDRQTCKEIGIVF